jgi:hypothetical protein
MILPTVEPFFSHKDALLFFAPALITRSLMTGFVL